MSDGRSFVCLPLPEFLSYLVSVTVNKGTNEWKVEGKRLRQTMSLRVLFRSLGCYFSPPFSDDAMTAFRIGVPPSGLVRMFCAALIAK